jgi:hypothetical protein
MSCHPHVSSLSNLSMSATTCREYLSLSHDKLKPAGAQAIGKLLAARIASGRSATRNQSLKSR